MRRRKAGREVARTLPSEPGASRRRRRIPLGVGAGLVLLSVFGAFTCGITWDETIHAGYVTGAYVPWLKSVWRGGLSGPAWSEPGLFYAFAYGQAHPPLGKLAMSVPTLLLGRWLPAFVTVRVAGVFWFALALLCLYRLVRRGAGPRAALVAMAVFGLMPRAFGHGHLAVLDMPVTALWLATVLAARRGLESRGWAVALGPIFGLALLAKVNAVFLPVAVLPWLLFYGRRRAILPTVSFLVLGPLTFFALWPALWHDPVLGAARYVVDKMGYAAVLLHPAAPQNDFFRWGLSSLAEMLAPSGRLVIPVYYLGRVYGAAGVPWHYAPVMLAATMPLGMLCGVLAFAGRRRLRALVRRPFIVLVAANLGVAVAPFVLGAAPAYDGIRLFLPAVPFLAIVSALGLRRLYRRLPAMRAARAVGPVRVAALFWAWHVLLLLGLAPFSLRFSGGAVGGVWGAHKAGLETTYWGDTLTQDALDFVNRHVRPGQTVLIGPVGDFVPSQLQLYGLLRRDVAATNELGRRDWDVLVLIPRQGMFRPWMWDWYREGRPVWSARLAGVPQCLIYARREAPR